MTLTILAANLLTSTLSGYLVTFWNHVKPVTFTIIDMTANVLIFYPLFIKLKDWSEQISVDILK